MYTVVERIQNIKYEVEQSTLDDINKKILF